MKFVKASFAMIAALTLAGCDTYVDRLSDDHTIQNVKSMPRNYVHYDIPSEGIRCRENIRRSELTCWNASGGEK